MSILLISFGPVSLGWQILGLILVDSNLIWNASHLIFEILVSGKKIRNKTQIKILMGSWR